MRFDLRKIRFVFFVKLKKNEISFVKIKSVFLKEKKKKKKKKRDLIWEKSYLFFWKVKKKWDLICKNQICFLKG